MIALFAALAAIASTGAKVAPPPAPYTAAYQPQGVDEIGLWHELDEDERILTTAPTVIHDEALNAYIRGVLCATVGTDRCRATRVYVVRTPLVNATMAPNGTMRVFTGLLLRMRSEAELGSVLGHEFGHFEARHTLAAFKARRSGTDLLSWAAVLAAMSYTAQSRYDFSNLRDSVYGRLARFSRDQERDADAHGIGYLNASALRPQAAAAMWQNVMAEAQASAAARGLKKPTLDRVAFFASHPPEAERAATLAALATPDGAARDDGAARYATAMARWWPLFLDDQVKLNDFGASEHIIASLAQGGWSAWLWLARGDLHRGRGSPRDLVNAAEFYARAVALDPMLADAHRGLGLSLMKTGRAGAGAAALRRYLQLRPDASDAAMIRMLVPEGQGGQP